MSEENVYQPPGSDVEFKDDFDLSYAGFWIRVLASIIDTVLILLVTAPLLLAVYGADYWQSASLVSGGWDILVSYVFPAVAVILFWIYKSATPGKMILRLKVVSLGETPHLSVGQAVIRYIGYYPAMLALMLGLIWVAFDKRKQGWHDKMANTAVVRVG